MGEPIAVNFYTQCLRGGHRPWNSPDAKDRLRAPVTCDPPAVMALCAACPRPHCPGDCRERKDLARTVGAKEAGLNKGIRVEDVAALYLARPRPSLAEIGAKLSISKSTVRYWLKKAGLL